MKNIVKPDVGYKAFPAFPTVLITVNWEGKKNIITLGMVHVFSFSPPLIGIGVAPKRHSFNMLKESGEFVLNVPGKELVEQTLLCGTKSGRDTDKFTETGLTPVKAEKVSAPLIAECPLNMECRIVQEIITGDHVWFIGEVLTVHMDESYNKEDMLTYWGGEFRLVGEVIRKR